MARSKGEGSPKKPSKTPKKADDVVLLGGPTEDGAGVHVLRKQGDTLSAGELRGLEHGKAIVGEVVTLKPREGMPMVCDVQTEVAGPSETKSEPVTKTQSATKAAAAKPAVAKSPRSHAGPARVSSPSYRKGWNAIWGSKKSTLN